jgi:acyl-[acyl carrier protein]--UDP-N-acetylglucosamine O-acyltransferase
LTQKVEHSEGDFAKKLAILEEKQKSNLDLVRKAYKLIWEKQKKVEENAAQIVNNEVNH